jgi:glycosyltransferase involved in cell wall biosynthesis
VKPLRLAVICDLREEGWHSMDLIGDMLMEALPAVAGGEIQATRLCPPMVPRWGRVPLLGRTARAQLWDRLTARLWDYPRWLAPHASDFDVFHIVDQSYAHLVGVLPAGRTIVTCHDLDAAQAALPGRRTPLDPERLLAAHILKGLERAAHVACVSHATERELLATGRVDPGRVSVVYEGVHPSCSPSPSQEWDVEVARLLGETTDAHDHHQARRYILHVGSTIPRKRIGVLLQVLAGVRKVATDVRLLRVGGPLMPGQRALAETLGVMDAIVELPFMDRPALASLYRRASLVVLPSDREGFGLPIVEAMACGTPVVASAIPALQEIGGSAATYCPPGDVQRWVDVVTALLRQQRDDPAGWEVRRQIAISATRRFDWHCYAAEMTKLYRVHAS